MSTVSFPTDRDTDPAVAKRRPVRARPRQVRDHRLRHPSGAQGSGVLVAGPDVDFGRIGAPKAWKTTIGSPDVLVGVADTGLDYTHIELASQVASVIDFTKTEDPPLCDPTDEQLAKDLGAPSDNLDFHGHGSWIGGNIAGALNGTGINGIAPGIKLVSLKISGWCGSAYDSTILDAFIWAPSTRSMSSASRSGDTSTGLIRHRRRCTSCTSRP